MTTSSIAEIASTHTPTGRPYGASSNWVTPKSAPHGCAPRGDLREEWFPPTRQGLEMAIALAAAHLQSFLAEIDAVRSRILASE
jgi:hypothetical protein